MSSDQSVGTSIYGGLMGVLQIVLIILKVAGTISWSWWIVLIPLWISLGSFFLGLLIMFIGLALMRR